MQFDTNLSNSDKKKEIVLRRFEDFKTYFMRAAILNIQWGFMTS